MSFNIRDYVSDDHIESIGEIATGQARIIQALTLDNSQKDKEIERLKDIIKEVREYIDHYETIRGYYEYEENGYEEYNYEEDLKQELLEILNKSRGVKYGIRGNRIL